MSKKSSNVAALVPLSWRVAHHPSAYAQGLNQYQLADKQHQGLYGFSSCQLSIDRNLGITGRGDHTIAHPEAGKVAGFRHPLEEIGNGSSFPTFSPLVVKVDTLEQAGYYSNNVALPEVIIQIWVPISWFKAHQ
jgi:hypothetical protein